MTVDTQQCRKLSCKPDDDQSRYVWSGTQGQQAGRHWWPRSRRSLLLLQAERWRRPQDDYYVIWGSAWVHLVQMRQAPDRDIKSTGNQSVRPPRWLRYTRQEDALKNRWADKKSSLENEYLLYSLGESSVSIISRRRRRADGWTHDHSQLDGS